MDLFLKSLIDLRFYIRETEALVIMPINLFLGAYKNKPNKKASNLI